MENHHKNFTKVLTMSSIISFLSFQEVQTSRFLLSRKMTKLLLLEGIYVLYFNRVVQWNRKNNRNQSEHKGKLWLLIAKGSLKVMSYWFYAVETLYWNGSKTEIVSKFLSSHPFGGRNIVKNRGKATNDCWYWLWRKLISNVIYWNKCCFYHFCFIS